MNSERELPSPPGDSADRARGKVAARRSSWLTWLPGVLAAIAAAGFLLATPSGLLGKTRMIGYAVCHQIASHSLKVGGHQLPLCARCTGTFAGAVMGLVGQTAVLRRSRAGSFPPPRVLVALVLFFVLLGIDGLNSYLTFFEGLPHAYEPSNWLRLTTGTLYGLAMSMILFPAVSFTLLRDPGSEPAVRTIRELGVLVSLGALLIGAVLTGWAPLLYPLALIGALGVVALLTSVNTVLIVMLARRENTIAGWRESAPALLAGFALSIIQIGLIGIVRYQLTGTFDGIPLLD
jgi:uncharacterized membrane protein